jgi:cytochrome c556
MRKQFWFVSISLLLTLAVNPLAHPAQQPAAPQQRAAAPAASTFNPKATVKDVMDYVVIPSSEFVFNSVGSVQGPNGAEDKQPRTDADWAEVRKNAVLLAEGANLLMVPGRHAAGPNDKSNNPGSELEPAQIDALMAKNLAGFAKAAQGLIAATDLALKAIDSRNAEALSDAGGEIDAACEACHLTFWYPNEGKQ